MLSLPSDLEPTRATLHGAARVVEGLASMSALAHPRWWHLGLSIEESGLRSAPLITNGGKLCAFLLNLKSHYLVLQTDDKVLSSLPLSDAVDRAEFEKAVQRCAVEAGLKAAENIKYPDHDGPLGYDPQVATSFLDVIVSVSDVFDQIRSELSGSVGPVNFWPHGFDMSFEWFGRTEPEATQINVGFYPRDDAYFYSSPHPFDEALSESSLPSGAVWNDAGWQGARLDLHLLDDKSAWTKSVKQFALRVHELAQPKLR